MDERDGGDVFSEKMIRRMESEYQACDKLVVLSGASQRSFEEFGYEHKTVVVLPGIDRTFFTPSAKPNASTGFRLCYVGRVALAKGIGYLLQAWKRLALPNAELLLIGEVQPDIKMILKKYATENARLTGFLPPQKVLDQCLVMGRQARARIESQFTLNHCNDRQISLYRSLANERRLEIKEGS